MDSVTNILLVGVGGQGVLLASELLSDAAFNSGMDVKKSEVHGMAQRGGVVSSHVRYGKKIYSPLIPAGECDVMLAFEQAEALRWAHTMKSSGTIVVNTRKLVPPIALTKGFEYPENPLETVRNRMKSVIPVHAQEIAGELGNSRVENTILLGVLSKVIDISPDIWKDVIRSRVPKGTENLNLSAFQRGSEAISGGK